MRKKANHMENINDPNYLINKLALEFIENHRKWKDSEVSEK